MLVDPITVAASAPNPALSFAIVNQDGYGAERRDLTSGLYDLKFSHGKLKDGERHYMQLLLSKDVTDPYTGAIRRKQASVSLSVSMPAGFTVTEMVNLIKAHTETLADADVTPTKFLQWQS
jgi:hypothetical protein